LGDGVENGKEDFIFIMKKFTVFFDQVPDEIIKRKVLRSGDGSHDYAKSSQNSDNSIQTERFGETFWGFGKNDKGDGLRKIDEYLFSEDKEMNDEDKKLIKIL
jgi:hypothetical protein